jgi:hypothetical protein
MTKIVQLTPGVSGEFFEDGSIVRLYFESGFYIAGYAETAMAKEIVSLRAKLLGIFSALELAEGAAFFDQPSSVIDPIVIAIADDARRYDFAKTLEGQIVLFDTLKNRGADALDEAIDDAMKDTQ